jgi:hypothetical protein
MEDGSHSVLHQTQTRRHFGWYSETLLCRVELLSTIVQTLCPSPSELLLISTTSSASGYCLDPGERLIPESIDADTITDVESTQNSLSNDDNNLRSGRPQISKHGLGEQDKDDVLEEWSSPAIRYRSSRSSTFPYEDHTRNSGYVHTSFSMPYS